MKSLVLISALSLLPAVLGVIDLSTYPLSAVLRQGNGEIYTLHWSFNVQEESIQFAVNVSTTGWVGLGLSPDGGMAGSDIVIGWVNSQGQAFFNDRYATTTGRPPIDNQQDWFLDEGMEEGGFTLLAFRRQWVTCDSPQDREIKADTTRLIFSWNEADPANDDPNEVMYHGQTNRGSLSVNLLGGQQDTPPDPVDVQSFTTTVNNINLPSSDTTYWCSAYRIPDEVIQQKRYITKVSPVVTENNELHVHHILVYECDGLDNSHVGYSAPCNSGGEVGDTVSQCRGGTLIAAWAIGATDFVFPADVAFPVGGPGAPSYLVMETHYDNPGLSSDIIDSSGLEFFYTSVARTYDAGILQIGHSVSQNMLIPPGTTNYDIFGDCSADCTSRFIPSGGINIFANVLHTHLAGSGVTLRHLRNTQQCGNNFEELEPVEQNLQYDFNYQQYNYLPRIVNVQPGDILRLECNYDTRDRTEVALGGDSTIEEMCLSFPVYYPKINLNNCISSVDVSSGILPFLDNTNYVSSSTRNNIITSFQSRSRSDLESALNEIDWNSDAVGALQTSVTDGSYSAICKPQTGQTQRFSGTLPEVQCAYQPPNICVNGTQQPTLTLTGSAAGISYSLLLLVMSLVGVQVFSI